METKICTKCKVDKSLDDFSNKKTAKDGKRSACKLCENRANSIREARYKSKRKEYRQTATYKQIKKKYYSTNKEKILLENSKWRQTFNGRLASYKKAAVKRGVEWLLTDEEFKSFWQLDCYYCGGEIATVGVDRINNSKPYILSNCRPCCSLCNTMKMDMLEEEFFNAIKLIVKNLNLC